jgi:hypothetical protein
MGHGARGAVPHRTSPNARLLTAETWWLHSVRVTCWSLRGAAA